MKKIIYCIALLAALLLVITIPVSAEQYRDDVAYIEKGGESVVFNGKTYLPITINGRVDDTDTTRIEVEFLNYEDEDKFTFFRLYSYEECDYILGANFSVNNKSYSNVYYIEDTRYLKTSEFLKNERVDRYVTYNNGLNHFLIDGFIEGWKNDGKSVEFSGTELILLEDFDLYSASEDELILSDVGRIFRKSDEGGLIYTYYLLDYREYDSSYFYSDGSLALDSNKKFVLYELTDANAARNLDESYSKEFKDEEEKKDDSKEEDSDIGTIIVIALLVICFVVIPLVIGVLATIFGFKARKRIYRRLFFVIATLSATVVLCFICVVITLSI